MKAQKATLVTLHAPRTGLTATHEAASPRGREPCLSPRPTHSAARPGPEGRSPGPVPVTPRYLGLGISLGPSGTSVTASLWTGSREGVEYQIHFETKIVRLTKRSPTTLSSASCGITASGEILQTDQGTSAGRPLRLPPTSPVKSISICGSNLEICFLSIYRSP